MKGVMIFLVLTLVLFMAEPVEPRFRSGFQNGLRKFKESKYPDRLKRLAKGVIEHGPAWMEGIASLRDGYVARLDDEMS